MSAADDRVPAGGPTAVSVDGAAFDRLAAVHRGRAARFACAFLGDAHLAEDMVQEALRRLFERRQQYPLATHFGPYLVKTVARLCIDYQRNRAAEKRWRSAGHSAAPIAAGDPVGSALRQETAALIAGAVNALPERERACFLMTVCEGLSYRDAADALTLSFSDVNNAVHRARVLLRKALGHALGMAASPTTGGTAS